MTKIQNVYNESRYDNVSNPCYLKINAAKPVLYNPDDPNLPLQVQVKVPEKSRRKSKP